MVQRTIDNIFLALVYAMYETVVLILKVRRLRRVSTA